MSFRICIVFYASSLLQGFLSVVSVTLYVCSSSCFVYSSSSTLDPTLSKMLFTPALFAVLYSGIICFVGAVITQVDIFFSVYSIFAQKAFTSSSSYSLVGLYYVLFVKCSLMQLIQWRNIFGQWTSGDLVCSNVRDISDFLTNL